MPGYYPGNPQMIKKKKVMPILLPGYIAAPICWYLLTPYFRAREFRTLNPVPWNVLEPLGSPRADVAEIPG